jgi:hypothetical protein
MYKSKASEVANILRFGFCMISTTGRAEAKEKGFNEDNITEASLYEKPWRR